MKLEADYRPEFESLKGLLLAMAQERSVDLLLRMIVDRLAERPHVALARIWLMAEGTDPATLAARESWLAQLCLEHNLTLSKRLHIELYGDTRGT